MLATLLSLGSSPITIYLCPFRFFQSVFPQTVFFQTLFSQSVFFPSLFFQSVFFQSVFFKVYPAYASSKLCVFISQVITSSNVERLPGSEKVLGSKPRVVHIYQMLPFLLLDHDGGHMLRVWHSHHHLVDERRIANRSRMYTFIFIKQHIFVRHYSDQASHRRQYLRCQNFHKCGILTRWPFQIFARLSRSFSQVSASC